MTDGGRGLTVNVGVIDGGTRSNVVAERARAFIDVRIARLEDAAAIEHAFAALRGRLVALGIGVATWGDTELDTVLEEVRTYRRYTRLARG